MIIWKWCNLWRRRYYEMLYLNCFKVVWEFPCFSRSFCHNFLVYITGSQIKKKKFCSDIPKIGNFFQDIQSTTSLTEESGFIIIASARPEPWNNDNSHIKHHTMSPYESTSTPQYRRQNKSIVTSKSWGWLNSIRQEDEYDIFGKKFPLNCVNYHITKKYI